MSLAVVAPLRRRDFRLFWLGQWVSQFGDNFFMVAQAWLVYRLTGSAGAMAVLALCSQIPAVLMLLVGGAVVDRLPRRQVAIWSDVTRAALVLGSAALIYLHRLVPWHMYLLAFGFGFIRAFAGPAFQALVQVLADQNDRTAANALVSAGHTAAGIAGPTLGGLLMAVGGPGSAYLLNGLSFLVAAAGMALTHPTEPARTSAATGRPLLLVLVQDLSEAFRLLVGKRFLLWTISIMALINVTGQAPVMVLRPWIASRIAGGDPRVLALAYTCFSVGIWITLTCLSALRLRRGRGLLVYAGLALAGICQIGLSLVRAPWQFWACELVLGAAVMFHGVIWPGLLQDSVPATAMGRIAAIDEFGSSVLYPLGLALVGGLAAAGHGAGAMLWGGVLTIAVSAAGLLLPEVRQA